MLITTVLVVLLLVLANGFFVAAEFALVKVRSTQVNILIRRGHLTARLTKNLIDHIDAYLSACQLGVTLASLGLGWLGEPLVATTLMPLFRFVGLPQESAHYVALPVAFALITFFHITLGELAPKTLAIQNARSIALAVSPPLFVFYIAFRPFIWLLNASSNLMLRAIGIRLVPDSERFHSEEEVRLIIMESTAQGALSQRERLMIENVLDLENKKAHQIMVPRRDIVYLDTQRSLEENLRIVQESGHTRFPVCDGGLDRVVGVLHTKRLLRAILSGEPFTQLTQIARKAHFVPDTTPLDQLLREFQRTRMHLAMVVDEFGTVSGMVTMENVLEELVGPIQDEFDHELPPIVRRTNGRFILDGQCPLDELTEQCGIELPDDIESDTAGGLVTEMLGRIPKPGETLKLGGALFTVLEADPTRVTRIELKTNSPKPTRQQTETGSATESG